jgi:hypothetical protein
MYWENSYLDDEIAELQQFRLKLIGLLRLPVNISEPLLREALRSTNADAFAQYLGRFNRVLEFKHRSEAMDACELHNQP